MTKAGRDRLIKLIKANHPEASDVAVQKLASDFTKAFEGLRKATVDLERLL